MEQETSDPFPYREVRGNKPDPRSRAAEAQEHTPPRIYLHLRGPVADE
jgi:hypothetical protein